MQVMNEDMEILSIWVCRETPKTEKEYCLRPVKGGEDFECFLIFLYDHCYIINKLVFSLCCYAKKKRN